MHWHFLVLLLISITELTYPWNILIRLVSAQALISLHPLLLPPLSRQANSFSWFSASGAHFSAQGLFVTSLFSEVSSTSDESMPACPGLSLCFHTQEYHKIPILSIGGFEKRNDDCFQIVQLSFLINVSYGRSLCKADVHRLGNMQYHSPPNNSCQH